MNRQWKVWFQRSDYSSDDFGRLSREEATAKFAQVDIEKECKDMGERIEGKKDWCEFGIGFTGSDGAMAHIYIDDCVVKSFTLRLERPKKKKLLGLIPISYTQTKHIERIKLDSVRAHMERIYLDFDSLFNQP